MPRIIPIQLLKCLKVLLDDNGGILSAGEVKRIAGLMTKYSKKLVSKCIYVQILKCTKTDLLVEFMEVGGWAMVYNWLTDSIRSMNWPLVQEILELFLLCPVDVNRLKINSAPKLVKGLTRDGGNESVRILATRLVEQWLKIVTDSTNIAVFTSPEQSAVVGDLKDVVGLPANIDPASTLHNNVDQASSLNTNIPQEYEYPYDEELDEEVNNIINTDTNPTTIETDYSNNSTGLLSEKSTPIEVNRQIIPIKVKQQIKRVPKTQVAKIVKSRKAIMDLNMDGLQEVDPLADVADISPIGTNYTLTPAQKKATEAGLVYKFIVKDGQQILAKVPQNMQKKTLASKKQIKKYLNSDIEMTDPDLEPEPEPVEEIQQLADDIVEITSEDEVDEIAIALTTEMPDGAVDVFGDIDDMQYNEALVKPSEEILDDDMTDSILEEIHNDVLAPEKYSADNTQYDVAEVASNAKIDTELSVDKKDINESLNESLNDTFKSGDDTDNTDHKSSSDSKENKDRDKERKTDKDKSRKSSSSSHKSSSSSHKSSSKSSSSSKSKSSSSSHRSSSDKYKNSDKDRSSSSKDKERREGGSSSANSSKQKSSSSKSSSSSSKDRSRDKDKSSTSSKKDKDRTKDEQIEKNKETLAKLAPQTLEKFGKIPKKPKEDTEIKQHISITIPSKKASMSIELRPDAEKAKTVKTYNSQFRSHGLTEEAPPPPSRKDLKKPKLPISPNAIPSVMSLSTTSFKRVLPIPQDTTVEKKPKISMDSIDPLKEKPGAVKLIPPKRKNGYWFFGTFSHTLWNILIHFVCSVYEVIFSVEYFETAIVARKNEEVCVPAMTAANIWATLVQ